MNARRRSIVAFGSVVTLAPILVGAQQPIKTHRVAILAPGVSTSTGLLIDIFKKALNDLGYTEGQNIVIDTRWAEGTYQRLQDLAAELLALKPDVFVAVSNAVSDAKRATATIPIIMVAVGDPVGAKLVSSLAKPGGNITGPSNMQLDTVGKIIELLRTIAPKAKRIAVLMTGNPTHRRYLDALQATEKPLNLIFLPTTIKSHDELEKSFFSLAKDRAQALIVLPDPLLFGHRLKIAVLAAEAKIPSMYQFREEVEAGGLISYGPSLAQNFKLAATYVDKILKGAKPADLPVQQPTEFELVINMKTAKALGITIRQEILLRADKVIE